MADLTSSGEDYCSHRWKFQQTVDNTGVHFDLLTFLSYCCCPAVWCRDCVGG